MAKVEVVLYHHEPLMLLLEALVTAVLTIWHPRMMSFLPQDKVTIYSNILYPSKLQLLLSLSRPGMFTMLFKGEVVNRKSKVRWLLTISY